VKMIAHEAPGNCLQSAERQLLPKDFQKSLLLIEPSGSPLRAAFSSLSRSARFNVSKQNLLSRDPGNNMIEISETGFTQ